MLGPRNVKQVEADQAGEHEPFLSNYCPQSVRKGRSALHVCVLNDSREGDLARRTLDGDEIRTVCNGARIRRGRWRARTVVAMGRPLSGAERVRHLQELGGGYKSGQCEGGGQEVS